MGLIGAHVSIAGGIELSIERGDSIACDSIQIFIQSSRTWKSAPLTEESVRAFHEAKKNAKHVKRVVAHNSYLLNLSTANEEVREKSVGHFIELFEKCERLGIEALITHPGSHLGAGMEEGIKQTSRSLDEVMAVCKGFSAKILLENTAGQGGCVGHRFEQLSAIAAGTKDPDRIGYCFDTQHAFAAGYDLRSEEAYDATFAEWDNRVGTKRIHVFHLNDAMKDLGCLVDRHENLGKGFIGETPFRKLMNDRRFKDVPMCLETAPGDDMENYVRELKLLRSFIKSS